MTTETQLRALTELVHAMRPTWDRAGIYAAVHGAHATRAMVDVAHAAIDAAADKSARTPAVIGTRDRTWQPTLLGNEPPPVSEVIRLTPSPDETARRGAANARQPLAKARAREDDDAKPATPPREDDR
jgi:hypothetical protein